MQLILLVVNSLNHPNKSPKSTFPYLELTYSVIIHGTGPSYPKDTILKTGRLPTNQPTYSSSHTCLQFRPQFGIRRPAPLLSLSPTFLNAKNKFAAEFIIHQEIE